MGSLFSTPWRDIYRTDFKETAKYLKHGLGIHKDTRLNIVLIGPTGSGKSTLINSMFSVSKGSICNKSNVKCDNLPGVGTHNYLEIKAGDDDLFDDIHFYDTMGIYATKQHKVEGISEADLRAVFEGRIAHGHEFNKQAPSKESVKENKPHCVIFVVSAEEMSDLDNPAGFYTPVLGKLESLHTLVPHDVASIAVITKIDRVCDYTAKDIRNIYYTETVRELVRKVEDRLGVQQNMIFPVVNFVKEVEAMRR